MKRKKWGWANDLAGLTSLNLASSLPLLLSSIQNTNTAMPTPTPVDMDAELAALETMVAQDDAAPAVVVREGGGWREREE
jgi:hypothetical protein